MNEIIQNYKAMSKYQKEVQGIHPMLAIAIDAVILAIVFSIWKLTGESFIWWVFGAWELYNYGWGTVVHIRYGKILREEGEVLFLMKFAGVTYDQALRVSGGWDKIKGE